MVVVMVELEIPSHLLENRSAGQKWKYGMPISDSPAWPNAPWVCFRLEIEEWITASMTGEVQIGPRWHIAKFVRGKLVQQPSDWYYVEFEDIQDATLFKLFWL